MPTKSKNKKKAEIVMKQVEEIRNVDRSFIVDNAIQRIRATVIDRVTSLKELDIEVSKIIAEELQFDLKVPKDGYHCRISGCGYTIHWYFDGLGMCCYHTHIGEIHTTRHFDANARLVTMCLVKDNTRYDHSSSAIGPLKSIFAPIYNEALNDFNCRLKKLKDTQ